MMKLGCIVLIGLFNVTAGTLCTQYLANMWLHHQINIFIAALIGLIGGQVIVPAAVITYLLFLGGAI